LKSSGISNIVIGVSGGLDSTHALIVAAKTMDSLNLPRSNVKAYTMPGFATSAKTYNNALKIDEKRWAWKQMKLTSNLPVCKCWKILNIPMHEAKKLLI